MRTGSGRPPAGGPRRGAAIRRTAAERLRLLRLFAGAGPWHAAGLTAVLLVTALTSSAQALATGHLVGRVVRPGGSGSVVGPLAVLMGVLLARQLGEALSDLFGASVAARIDGAVRREVRAIALQPDGIAHLDGAAFRDDVARACDLGTSWRLRSPGTAATGHVLLTFRVVGALSATLVLAREFPFLAVALLAASLLMRAILRRQWIHLADVEDGLARPHRQSGYWAELVATPAAAKEVRMFGLADWAMRRRLDAELPPARTLWAARRAVLRRQGPTLVLAGGSAFAAMTVPGLAAVHGHLGSGALTTCLVAAWGIFQIGLMGHEAFDIEYGMSAVHALDRLRAAHGAPTVTAPAAASTGSAPAAASTVTASAAASTGTAPAAAVPPTASPAVAAPASAAPLVCFEDVAFRYPGTAVPVLRHLDLELRPGEVVALVGVNGAGKTTLGKLLGGLYRPDTGRVSVDGRDLATLDIAAWRHRLAVVPQDFVHYPATLRDNVALAAPELPADDGPVLAALEAAGAAGLAGGLPEGLDTWLRSGGANGAELSGGQWQKVALARAVFAAAHGRQVLVFDEPTAHLDIAAEAEFHRQVIGAVTDTSVLLISHRLSTVRHADRIVLLDGGRISEAGTHDQLLRAEGEYARLFELQAARFTRGARPWAAQEGR